MFRPSSFGLIFAGLCTQSAAFRKTWSSERQPDKLPGTYGVENATEDATEAAATAKWYLKHLYNRASDATGYGDKKAKSCSEEAKTQWQNLNFIVSEDKKNGHVYLRCKNGDPSKKFKVACLREECNPGAVVSPRLPVPGQREWCFVANSCGGWYGPCEPLAPKDTPLCPADLIDSFKDPKNVPENVPVACPHSCHSPNCLKGASHNGGVPLEDDKCLHFASKVYKKANVRYCGSTDEYRKPDSRDPQNTFVDCTGCRAPEVAGLPVVEEVDAELEEDDASAHTNEAGPVVKEVDAGSKEDAPLDVEQDASAHTVEAEPLIVEVEQDASAHTVEAEEDSKDASAHTVEAEEDQIVKNVPEANSDSAEVSVPERIVDPVVPDVVGKDGPDQAILEPEHVAPTVVEPKETTILEPEKPDNNSVPKENLGPEGERTPTTPEASLRFAGTGSKANSGRLEIFHEGEWGTVCENSWGEADAKVACKQLGFSGGMLVYNEFGEGPGRIWLDEVECVAHEDALHKCKHVDWGETLGCDHGQDVALECLCPDCEKEEVPPPPTQPDYTAADITEHQWTPEEMQAALTLAGLQYEAPRVVQEDVEGSFQLRVQAKAHDGSPIDGAVFEASDTTRNPPLDLIGRSEPTAADGWATLTSVNDMTVKVTATGCNDAREAWSVQRKCTGGDHAGCTMLIVMNCNERVHGVSA